MSCPEVVYQAYYPYLYQRPPGSTTAPPPANAHRSSHFSAFTHHQYDRFNVQRCLDQPSTSALATNSMESPYPLTVPQQQHSHSSHHSSAGSVSSGGGIGSPGSPTSTPIVRYKEEEPVISKEERREVLDDEEDDVASPGEESSRAQYLSANCVLFTNYTGDVSTVVDEHFTRALNYISESSKSSFSGSKDYTPMATRNFPPSFWNSEYQFPVSAVQSVTSHHTVASANNSEFYSGESAYHAAVAAAASTSSSSDPWHSHYQQYAAHHHHRAVHEYHHHHHHHNMAAAAQYGSLLLPTTSRLPAHMASQYHHHHSKSAVGIEHWSQSHSAAAAAAAVGHHTLESASSPYTTAYPSMAAGLEAQAQESSKDLYWF